MRPTASIRRHLLLRRLHDRVIRLGKDSLNELKQSDIQLLHVEARTFDIFVEYKCRGRIYEAVCPIPMIDAEIEGWLQQTSLVLEAQHEKGQ